MKPLAWALAVLCLWAGLVAAQTSVSQASVYQLFARGNQLYEAGEFEDALDGEFKELEAEEPLPLGGFWGSRMGMSAMLEAKADCCHVFATCQNASSFSMNLKRRAHRSVRFSFVLWMKGRPKM